MKKTMIILAGGQSRRMGENKAFLTIDDKSFIESILERFSDYEERIIVANDVFLYQFDGAQTIQDIYPNKGPLCGLYTGLKNMSNDRALVVTVDTPLISRPLMDYLWTLTEGVDALIPVVDGHYQSLCAVYNKTALEVIEQAVENDERKVRLVLNRLNVKTIDESSLKEFGDLKTLFANVNTPEDYKRINK